MFLARFHGEAGFQKDVALKFLKPSARDNLDLIARLRDEARLLGLLKHRSIVQVDRLIRLRGAWVIVMEYVPGADLDTLMSGGPLPPGPALEIIYEVASALNAAYERTTPDGQPLRLTHRDIKPGNIRITGFGDVKVLDFGIARAEFEGQETAGPARIMGTPAYMSPERFNGIDGPAGDVYGLGVVACEMLTGSRFGRVKSTRKAHRQAVKEYLERLDAVDGIPADASKLVGRMLHHEPTMRPLPAEVGRASRKLASRCSLTLADWAESGLHALSPEASAVAEQRPKTSIVVEDNGTQQLQGSMLGELPEGLDGLDLTGQLIGQSLTPDNLVQSTLSSDSNGVDDGSTLADVFADPIEPEPQPEPEAHTTDLAEESPPPKPETRGVSTWLVGLLLLLVGGIVAQPYLRDSSEIPEPLGELPTGNTAPAKPAEARPAAAEGSAADGALEPSTPDAPSAAPEQADPPEAATAIPEPVPSAPPKAASSPAQPPVVATSSAPAPAPAADPPEPTAKPEPPPPAPPTPTGVAVGLAGDAQWVLLVGAEGRFRLPTQVPPGRYEIEVTYPGEAAEEAGSIQIVADKPVTVSCDNFFRQCNVL